MQPDADLVRSVLAGDRAAYAGLVARYERVVHATAFTTLRDHHAAQDVTQDTFVTAYQKLPMLRDPKTFGAWLLTIARRTAVDRARLVPTHALPDDHPAPDPPPDDRTDDILAALSRLPDHERQTILLRYFDDHPVATIAALTGRSVGTVTKQLSRALKRLRERLPEKSS